jgi:hypothetical protein
VTLIDTATDKVAAVSKPWRATDQKAGLEEGRDPDDTVAHRAFLYLMGFGGRISRSLRLRDTARQIGQNH